MKEVLKPVTDIVKDVSKDLTKIMTETSEENNKALANLKDKVQEILHDKGTTTSYLLSPSSKITKHEHTSQLN